MGRSVGQRRARAKGSLNICSLGQGRAGQGRASSRDGSVELRSRGAWVYLGVGSSACHEPGVEVRELGKLRDT